MANLFFTSPEHKQRFLTAMLTLGKISAGSLDPEYASALYILTADAEAWNNAEHSVSRSGIDIEALLKNAFSHGEQILVRLAGNLFNGNEHLDPLDFMTLDESNFTLALTALQIRRVSLPLRELASKAELSQLERDGRNRINAENRPKPWLPLQPGE